MIRYFSIVFAVFFVIDSSGQEAKSDSWKEGLSSKNLRNAALGFHAVDMESGKTIIDYQSSMTLTPASVTKMVSGLWSYNSLGSDYQFETKLAYNGAINPDGTLQGDVYWVANGDPSFGSKYAESSHQWKSILAKAIEAIREANIQCIEGDLVLYLSGYSSQSIGDHWSYQDIGNYYGGGAYGMNILDNSYDLVLQQNLSLGSQVSIVKTNPELEFQWKNELVSGSKGSGDQAYIYGDPYSRQRSLRGSIPAGKGEFVIKGALPDPPSYFIHDFALALQESGIEFRQTKISNARPADKGKELVNFPADALLELVKHSLAKSDNLYAQALFLRAASLPVPSKACSEMSEFLENLGLDENSYFFHDGNGLSPANAVSAAALTELLQVIQGDPKLKSYLDLLPSPDESSSLRAYTSDIPSTHIRAKTGGFTQVRAISGWMKTKSGRKIAFAFLANNYSGGSSSVYKIVNQCLKDLYLTYE